MPSSRPTRLGVKRATRATIVLALLLTVGGYIALRHNVPVLEPSSCAAAGPGQPIPLDVGQAAIAATIAGVAHYHDLPRRAVTVAYATALQESKLTNLRSGDRDSVGVFQQRPSQGWGPARRIEDPVYATTRFFEALVQVHGYETIPVYQAAQAVQHSADGSAYSQYASVAKNMTKAFTGELPHGVWCWYSTPVGKRRLAAADRALTQAFGPLRVGRRGDPQLAVRVRHPAAGWAVADWLVSHAASYGIQTISYQGYKWVTKEGSSGWTRIKAGQRPKAPPAVVLFG
ncbi:MAG TPA: hypothetical protein VHU92_10910 [Streptosporangiaceae bacterium]|nr:hypothetical protein [Streptosporangiaceae bacterium]